MTETPAVNQAYLEDASGLVGYAERVFIPQDEQALAELLRKASHEQVPVTVSGAGTGVVGGRVPQGGWVLSTEYFKGLQIFTGRATAGAGVLLRDLHAAAAATGQLYAPDPTETASCVGGNVATNASGSRSFRYGATRQHVLALRVVLASGEILHVRRGQQVDFSVPAVSVPSTTKHSAGYALRPGMDWVDLFVGSEGTLGVITEAELRLLPMAKSILAGVIFFTNHEDVLDAVDRWRPVPQLRMLEYFDRQSLNMLRVRFPMIPITAGAALLIEQELGSEEDSEISYWVQRLEQTGALPEDSWFGTSTADRDRFRHFRHALPELVNETLRRNGSLKMASDCAVPIQHNSDMLQFYRLRLEEAFPGRYLIFGHIGDGHLHVNVLPRRDEVDQAAAVLTEFAREAVSRGGTVSGEHGLGKLKARLLEIQFSREEIEAMKQVKRRLDPSWILGRGTFWGEDTTTYTRQDT
jgi:FAD/FMN-containing dehydrogenase